jgi:hypothetical protein
MSIRSSRCAKSSCVFGGVPLSLEVGTSRLVPTRRVTHRSAVSGGHSAFADWRIALFWAGIGNVENSLLWPSSAKSVKFAGKLEDLLL